MATRKLPIEPLKRMTKFKIDRTSTNGGARVGAGRPKGGKNKSIIPMQGKGKQEAIQAQIELAEYTGETPLEFMLNVMRDHKLHVNTRLQAARDAAPYVHAKLQSITVKGDPNSPLSGVTLTPKEYQNIVTEALSKI